MYLTGWFDIFLESGFNGINGLPEDPDELSCEYPNPIKIIEKNKLIIYLLERFNLINFILR